MGHSFDFRDLSDRAVQRPDWHLAEQDRDAYCAAWSEFFDHTAIERGCYECSYSWSGRILDALRFNGVLDDTDPGAFEGSSYTTDDAFTAEWIAYAGREAPAHRVFAFKFSSSDPWLITPAECRTIAYALHQHPDPDIAYYGKFCGVAARYGGLEVG